ncbi:MAG: hypothetical protein OXT67_12250 [Zetaproteobacteria bacterium]|nr:hypothetical protein [Zetaproteobacteria bacterium]
MLAKKARICMLVGTTLYFVSCGQGSVNFSNDPAQDSAQNREKEADAIAAQDAGAENTGVDYFSNSNGGNSPIDLDPESESGIVVSPTGNVVLRAKPKPVVARVAAEEGGTDGGAELVTTIQDACANLAARQSLEEVLSFPQTDSCQFGQNGNLEPINNGFQAVASQSQQIAIPEGHAVCDIQMNSITANLRYDDFMLFTLDDYVLFSTNAGLLAGPASPGDTPTWKKWTFDAIKGTAWGAEEVTCFGLAEGDKCTVPGHDEQGELDLFFASGPLSELSSQVYKRSTNLDFKLHILGDNDAGDCEHTGLDLRVNISVVPVP